MTVAHAMTPGPLTVTPRTSVATALRLARDNGISRLPVVEHGRLIGVVREERLLAFTPSEATTLSRHELHDALSRLTVERAVEPAIRLSADTPLTAAARHLLERGAHEALVVEGERLVGILTHSDLLRALVAGTPEAVA
jgi:acetoin utilization protein AcuB